MKRATSIRNNFKQRFQQIAERQNLKTTNEWHLHIPPDDLLLVKWKSEPLKKVMRLQEADEDEVLQFGYALGKSGLEFEYDDLLINTIDSHNKVTEIFSIYRLWFLENQSPQDMEKVLDDYYEKFNLFLQAA
jgi:hypothetical protein